jgi:hypothetical protein
MEAAAVETRDMIQAMESNAHSAERAREAASELAELARRSTKQGGVSRERVVGFVAAA